MTNDFQTPTYVSVKRGTDPGTLNDDSKTTHTTDSTDADSNKPSHSYNLRSRH